MNHEAIFQLQSTDPSGARAGLLRLAHGTIETPVFMPVGTQGSVKGLDVLALQGAGTKILLGNTYHLVLRPGADRIERLGGLHAFMGWSGPILTDSGGFQLFSLAQRTRVDESGATFRSHIDGRQLVLTPERAMEIQGQLGSDIAMVLDHVVPLPSDRQTVQDASERSIRWAARCQQVPRPAGQLVFAIVQGGLDVTLRHACARGLVELDFPGYAVGGLSVGEPNDAMLQMVEATCAVLPADRPRYLMGVGRPEDLLEGMGRGIDMFDCVMPTRNGRNGLAFTCEGPVRIRNLQHAEDRRPLDCQCPCLACRHSRAYLRHLFMAGEMLGPVLLSLHNITFYHRLMAAARAAILAGTFAEFRQVQLHNWQAPKRDGLAPMGTSI